MHRSLAAFMLCLTPAVAVAEQGASVRQSAAGASSSDARAAAATSAPAAPEGACEKPSAMPSLLEQLPDYRGDFTHRRYLSGDWGGSRTQLAETGILFDLDLAQWLQGNAHGGKDTNRAFRYSGSADFTLRLDTARMNLWPGGLITLHGETQIAQSINGKVGALGAPNYQALLPVPGDSGLTTLSEYYITQALSKQFVLLAGKIDLSTGDTNEFAHNQRTQFSNLAFRVNPVLFNAAPYTAMAAGAIWLPADWLTISSFVADNDPEGAATTTGFNTAFHGRRWLSVMQEVDFTWKPFGLTGHQRFGWFWTSRDFTEFSGDSRIQLPFQPLGRGLLARRLLPPWLRALRFGDRVASIANPDTRGDNWAIYYNFDQYVFTEAEDHDQGLGFFGRFGLAPSEGNIFDRFYSLGVGGKGSIPCRDRDNWGVGYYFADVNSGLPAQLGMSAEQGVEAYYNIEVFPWLHISPDLQVIIDPGAGFGERDTSIVYGLRAQMTF